MSNPIRFSTKWQDDETGLLYYGDRYYNAHDGRFINRDPVGETGGINLYGFCSNDPIDGWDMLGNTGNNGATIEPWRAAWLQGQTPAGYAPCLSSTGEREKLVDPEKVKEEIEKHGFAAIETSNGTYVIERVGNNFTVKPLSEVGQSGSADTKQSGGPDTKQGGAPKSGGQFVSYGPTTNPDTGEVLAPASGRMSTAVAPNNFAEHGADGNSPVHHTYHSLLITNNDGRGIEMAQQLYRALRTFRFFNRGSLAKVALNRQGDRAFFAPNSLWKEGGLKAGNFASASPVTLHFNPDAFQVRAETDTGHFLVGVRYWGVEVESERSPAQIRLYTEAYEEILPPASFMEGAFKADQMKIWTEYLTNTALGVGFTPEMLSRQGVVQVHEIELSGQNPFFNGGPDR